MHRKEKGETMFYVKNIETGKTVKRCDSHYEAEMKMESLKHNGKDMAKYKIVPTEDFIIPVSEARITNIYDLDDGFKLEVFKETISGEKMFSARLVKNGYGLIYDLGSMPILSRVNSQYSGTYHFTLTEEEFVAMMLNGINDDIERYEDEMDG